MRGDRYGNLVFRRSARNFNPLAAMAGTVAVAEVEELADGALHPDEVHLPGVFVQRVVPLTAAQAADKSIEKATEKLLKDSKAYTDSITNLFTNATDFAAHFATIFHPLGSEYGLESKHPEAEHTITNVDSYAAAMEDLKSSVVPELELIESRIVGPIKEFQGILKAIRKSITKREHKVCLAPAIR